jgi:polysaccharide pyruvyl transferase CsaB
LTRSKRITLSGYYGLANTGDEAVLWAIIRGIKSRAGDSTEITVLSATPEETAERYGVKAVSRMSPREVLRTIRETDLLISGGGSLIQDATSAKSLFYYLAIIVAAKICRCKVMVLGQGIGPLDRWISRRMTAVVLSKVDLITVRDTQSAELLSQLGIRRPTVRVTADPTLAIDPCEPVESERLLAEAGLGSDDQIIAIALRDWRKSPGLEEAITSSLAKLSQMLPVRLLLITMQAPDDEELARRIQASVKEVVVQPRPWTPSQLMGVLNSCRLVVAMRLHTLIFSTAVGIPALGIIYDPKVEYFLAATGQHGVTLQEVMEGILPNAVIDAWSSRDALVSRLSETVPTLREAAAQNIELALDLLDL